jgi:branched-subunit amino acid transport protein
MAALIGVQTFTSDAGPVLDARFAAVVIAVLLAIVRAPFLVIVVSAAAVAALLRLWF